MIKPKHAPMASIYPFPPKPIPLSDQEKINFIQSIKHQLHERNAVMIAHYYTDPEIQALAEETGGFVGDSLEMAKFGQNHSAETLLICGVRFMGESAKILTPNKRVIMPTLAAECSLDLSCPESDFNAWCDAYPDHTVVVYANTSAAVKARADWVVTSSIALPILEHLDAQGAKILWGPDRHLGAYLQKKTGADMTLWQGECVVHDEFSAKALNQMKHLYPDAAVLVHPESPLSVVALADAVGSTSQLIQAAKTLPQEQLIVATDRGIFYKMQQKVPNKTLLEAPTAGAGATCRSCAHCPWMAMNGLKAIHQALVSFDGHEIFVADDIREKAMVSLNRLMTFHPDNV